MDLSNFQSTAYGGVDITSEIVRQWRDLGVKKAIFRLPNYYDKERALHEVIFFAQVGVCKWEGMPIETYQWAYLGNDPVRQIEYARSILGKVALLEQRCWLDLEEQTTKSRASVRDFIKASLVLPNMGIYTGRGWWEEVFGVSGGFEDKPLWDASWVGDGKDPITIPPLNEGFVPYGGWVSRAMRQYGYCVLGGVTVDVNVYRA